MIKAIQIAYDKNFEKIVYFFEFLIYISKPVL